MFWTGFFCGAYAMGALVSFFIIALCLFMGESSVPYGRSSVWSILRRSLAHSLVWPVSLPCLVLGIL